MPVIDVHLWSIVRSTKLEKNGTNLGDVLKKRYSSNENRIVLGFNGYSYQEFCKRCSNVIQLTSGPLYDAAVNNHMNGKIECITTDHCKECNA